MIRIRTHGNDSKRVRELFLREFARTILLGMGETPDDGTDVLERATDCLKDELPSKTTADGISFGTEIEQVDMQSLAEATAKYVFGRRCFRNEFGSPEATATEAAERTLEAFPNIEIKGEVVRDSDVAYMRKEFLDWSGCLSNAMERFETRNGRVVRTV